jgi:hypothetical protein
MHALLTPRAAVRSNFAEQISASMANALRLLKKMVTAQAQVAQSGLFSPKTTRASVFN